jgi:CubicO group peptidase (beta-lactamase class C family)
MSEPDEIEHRLRERLPALLVKFNVPAAAVAVLAGGEVIDVAAGVLNTSTGVEATVDSVFQIGSITKVWTSTLLMQLVDEHKLDIDAPVQRYLPDFRTADADAAATITVRQLMSHTAGFEGDLFTDTGKGDDCVEKYVATLVDVPQLFPPGAMFSYNNAGYCVLGRVVEVLRGKPFDACMREHLFEPLGLTHAANGADEAILFRAAVGHIEPSPGGEQVPAPVWSLARSNAPAGSSLAMRARDLVAFARMHIDGGKASDGTVVLSSDSVEAMQRGHVTLPDFGLMGDAWGLGWELFDWPGGPVIGHDGGTIGQAAMLRVAPGRRTAVALLTNGGNPYGMYAEIFGRLLRELAGVAMPALPAPPSEPTPPAPPAESAPPAEAGGGVDRYVGTYANQVVELTVTRDAEGRLLVEQRPKGLLADLGGEIERNELVHVSGDRFVPREPRHGIHPPHVFVGDDGTGRALFVHSGRAIRRVPTSEPASHDHAVEEK